MKFQIFWTKVLSIILIALIIGCAPAKLTTKYTKKDHFMVGKYEVGAIEYENGKRGEFIIKWSFPVYLNGQKIKTYNILTESVSGIKMQKEAQKEFDKGAKVAYVQKIEWCLQVEVLDGKAENIKSYPGTSIYYDDIKKDVIDILNSEQ